MRPCEHETRLNCSIGIATSRLVAKISSDQAKPNGVLWVMPGQEARFLAPLDVRKVPGVGKVTEKNLHALGIRKIGDLARFDEAFLESRFGKWGLALAGKARGLDAGGWFDSEVGADTDPKSISHEHTYGEDTADADVLEATLARLSEMVGRRLRENGLHARTLQLKLRYKDFSTITRAHTLERATQIDTEIFEEVRALFRKNWKPGAQVRLLGVHASSFDDVGAAARSAGRGQARALGTGAGGGRSPARQVRRIGRIARFGHARPVPRAHARKSRRPSRESPNRPHARRRIPLLRRQPAGAARPAVHLLAAGNAAAPREARLPGDRAVRRAQNDRRGSALPR